MKAASEEPFLARQKFDFSTKSDLRKRPTAISVLVWTVLILVSIWIPATILLNRYEVLDLTLPRYALFAYIIVLNTVVLVCGSEYVVATLAYPYSNGHFRTTSRHESSASFSLEYLQCIQRLVATIQNTLQKPDCAIDTISHLENEHDAEQEEYARMKPSETYMRVSSFVDLIELYADINRQLIAENSKRHTSTF